MNYAREYITELIGTMLLVIFGCGSAVAANTLIESMGLVAPLGFTTLLVAFAFGLVFIAIYYSIGSISGSHINPAVSLGMFICGKMDLQKFLGYVLAQIIGGVAGAGILTLILPSGKDALGANGFNELSAMNTGLVPAFTVEVILAFVFVITVIMVTAKAENKSISGLVIGFTLTLVHIFGIPFTGTSVNPARSLGPAMFTGGEPLSQVWLFVLAPFVGAALAAIAYMLLDKSGLKSVE